MNSPSVAISVHGLKKSYGEVHAVKGIDFEIQPGEVFGLLGPNGAGKTTTVEILEGLLARSGGEVAVLGFDPDRQRQQLKDRIGVCLQATNLPEKIRVREAMQVFASFYSRHVDLTRLLQRLQLEEKHDAFYSTLSGGQKQRLALALSLDQRSATYFPGRTHHRPRSPSPCGDSLLAGRTQARTSASRLCCCRRAGVSSAMMRPSSTMATRSHRRSASSM